MIATTEIRNLRAGDILPKGFASLFPVDWKFDSEWLWVAAEGDAVAGVIMAAPCHGTVIIQAVYVEDGRGMLMLQLFRAFLKDCLDRGFKAYMAYTRSNDETQQTLLTLAKRAKAVVFPQPMLCFGGTLEDAARW